MAEELTDEDEDLGQKCGIWHVGWVNERWWVGVSGLPWSNWAVLSEMMHTARHVAAAMGSAIGNPCLSWTMASDVLSRAAVLSKRSPCVGPELHRWIESADHSTFIPPPATLPHGLSCNNNTRLQFDQFNAR